MSPFTAPASVLMSVLLLCSGPAMALDWRYLPESDQGVYRPLLDPPLQRQPGDYPNGLPGQADTLQLKPAPRGLMDIFRVGIRTSREDAFQEDRSAVQLATQDMDQSLARQAELPVGSQVPDLFQDAFSEIPLTLDFGILIVF